MNHIQDGTKLGEWKNIKCPKCTRINIGWQENCLVCHTQLFPGNKQTQHIHSMSCSKCGATVNKGQKFCLQCGCKVVTLHEKPCCPNCGAGIKPEQQFCVQCGCKV